MAAIRIASAAYLRPVQRLSVLREPEMKRAWQRATPSASPALRRVTPQAMHPALPARSHCVRCFQVIRGPTERQPQ